MKRATMGALVMSGLWVLASVQAAEGPTFEAADVRVSPKTANPFPRTGPVRGGRYEVKTATMVDLIRTAYGFDADKIVGGPNWLELDRFDVTGKVPQGSDPESQKQMLQAVLEERFQLKLHKETRPLPVLALTAGKKPSMKEASGTEETGCKPQTSSGAPSEGAPRLMMMSANGGAPMSFTLGPGMTIQYNCRNVTMAAFAEGMRGMMGASLNSPVVDETGLKGKWNFDLKFSMGLIGPLMGQDGDRISIYTAVDKQLGLKLEEKQVPLPVLVVDRVERKPKENPADTAEKLPPLPPATEFEVASIKLVAGGPGMMRRFSMQPGGRFVVDGMPLRFLLDRAFNTGSPDELVGVPAFANSDQYDINAKVPAGSSLAESGSFMDNEALSPLLLSLLQERFKLKYHTEERELTAYALVASKPKLKKADPESRIYCKNQNAPAGAPPGSRLLACQNATMDLLAERLRRMTPELAMPVANNTGLEGGYDLNLIFSFRAMPIMGGPMRAAMGAGGGGGGGETAGAAPGVVQAADPQGGYSVFEAIEKQLGLKLEKQKRTLPVIVIDHLEQKPTEN